MTGHRHKSPLHNRWINGWRVAARVDGPRINAIAAGVAYSHVPFQSAWARVRRADSSCPGAGYIRVNDTSGRGTPDRELNSALREWFTEASADPALRERLEVAIVTFDSQVRVLRLTDAPNPSASAFALVETVSPPELCASGLTLMLPAIKTAVRLATERSRELSVQAIPSRASAGCGDDARRGTVRRARRAAPG